MLFAGFVVAVIEYWPLRWSSVGRVVYTICSAQYEHSLPGDALATVPGATFPWKTEPPSFSGGRSPPSPRALYTVHNACTKNATKLRFKRRGNRNFLYIPSNGVTLIMGVTLIIMYRYIFCNKYSATVLLMILSPSRIIIIHGYDLQASRLG